MNKYFEISDQWEKREAKVRCSLSKVSNYNYDLEEIHRRGMTAGRFTAIQVAGSSLIRKTCRQEH